MFQIDFNYDSKQCSNIGEQVFYRALKSVYTQSSTPPIIENQGLLNATQTRCKLYVPIGSKEDYQAAPIWERFDIMEYDVSSINEAVIKKPIIYPNPTTGKAFIETTNGITPQVRVLDMQGNLLQQMQSNEIDLSGYNSGIYLVEVNGETVKVLVTPN